MADRDDPKPPQPPQPPQPTAWCSRGAYSYPEPPDLSHLPEFEAHAVYRATFLALYPPAQAAGLERAAREWYYRALEAGYGPQGSATASDLRMAARDLEVTASFLTDIAEGRFRASLEEADARLAEWAEVLAVEVAAVARAIRGKVGEAADPGGAPGAGEDEGEEPPPPPPDAPPPRPASPSSAAEPSPPR